MISALRLTRIALFGAILLVFQISLSVIPNGELVTLLLILISIHYPKDAILTSIVFCLLEVVYWGFGVWIISYFYIWPLLVILTRLNSKIFGSSVVMWTIHSAFFGLMFGALCALVYIPVSPSYALTYWIVGLKFDFLHCFFNAVICFLLFKPLNKCFLLIKQNND